MVDTWFITIMLFLSILSPGAVELPPAQSVTQAVSEMQTLYPEWQGEYKVNEFDCSEMSAMVYEYLRCEGFKPVIMAGQNSQGMGHAWVECDGKIIEATWPGINPDKGHYRQFNYFNPAMCDATEWDWWNSNYIRNIMNYY
jgi:hypothetical protein